MNKLKIKILFFIILPILFYLSLKYIILYSKSKNDQIQSENIVNSFTTQSGKNPEIIYNIGKSDNQNFTHSREREKEGIKKDLEYFKEWAKYPPKSRPLNREQIDILEYWWVRMPYQPMPSRSVDGFINGTKYYCRIQPLEHSLTEGKDMFVTLSCSDNSTGIRLLPLEINNTQIRRLVNSVVSETHQKSFDDFNDDGFGGDLVSGDKIYTFRYKPGKSDSGQIFVFVDFNIPDESSFFGHTLSANFLSTPISPAKFTGEFQESIKNGSLSVEAGINVLIPGRYQT